MNPPFDIQTGKPEEHQLLIEEGVGCNRTVEWKGRTVRKWCLAVCIEGITTGALLIAGLVARHQIVFFTGIGCGVFVAGHYLVADYYSSTHA